MVVITTIGIRLEPQEKALLAAIARRTDTTISQILRKLIRDYIIHGGQDLAEQESVHRRVAMVLADIAENRELSLLLLNNNPAPGFAKRLFTLPQIGDLFQAALTRCPTEQERAATVSFVIHGSYRLLQEWINQEERLPPDAQTALMLHLAHRACR